MPRPQPLPPDGAPRPNEDLPDPGPDVVPPPEPDVVRPGRPADVPPLPGTDIPMPGRAF